MEYPQELAIILLTLYFIVQGVIEGQYWKRYFSWINIDYHGWRFFEGTTVFHLAFGFYEPNIGWNIETLFSYLNFLGIGLIGNWIYAKFLDKVQYGDWFKKKHNRDYFVIFNIRLMFNHNKYVRFAHKYIYELSLIPAIILILL